jgi:hypothetical protein
MQHNVVFFILFFTFLYLNILFQILRKEIGPRTQQINDFLDDITFAAVFLKKKNSI